MLAMNAQTVSPETCPTQLPDLPVPGRMDRDRDLNSLPVIPLMSREEGERLISMMPQRSLQEALEMMEKVLGRPMPLVEDGTKR